VIHVLLLLDSIHAVTKTGGTQHTEEEKGEESRQSWWFVFNTHARAPCKIRHSKKKAGEGN
jgi:hypothetical protein